MNKRNLIIIAAGIWAGLVTAAVVWGVFFMISLNGTINDFNTGMDGVSQVEKDFSPGGKYYVPEPTETPDAPRNDCVPPVGKEDQPC